MQFFESTEPTVTASNPSSVTLVIPQMSLDDDENEIKNEVDYKEVWPYS